MSGATNDGDSAHQAVRDVEEASILASAVTEMAAEVEGNFVRMNTVARSEEMAYIYNCVDNFVDRVVPSIEKDLDMLEKVVGSLEIYHETKSKPVGSFLKGVMGALKEINTVPESLFTDDVEGADGVVTSSTDGQRLVKYCSSISTVKASELQDMMYAERGERGEGAGAGEIDSVKNTRVDDADKDLL
jgi:hypothetical protein